MWLDQSVYTAQSSQRRRASQPGNPRALISKCAPPGRGPPPGLPSRQGTPTGAASGCGSTALRIGVCRTCVPGNAGAGSPPQPVEPGPAGHQGPGSRSRSTNPGKPSATTRPWMATRAGRFRKFAGSADAWDQQDRGGKGHKLQWSSPAGRRNSASSRSMVESVQAECGMRMPSHGTDPRYPRAHGLDRRSLTPRALVPRTAGGARIPPRRPRPRGTASPALPPRPGIRPGGWRTRPLPPWPR